MAEVSQFQRSLDSSNVLRNILMKKRIGQVSTEVLFTCTKTMKQCMKDALIAAQ